MLLTDGDQMYNRIILEIMSELKASQKLNMKTVISFYDACIKRTNGLLLPCVSDKSKKYRKPKAHANIQRQLQKEKKEKKNYLKGTKRKLQSSDQIEKGASNNQGTRSLGKRSSVHPNI